MDILLLESNSAIDKMSIEYMDESSDTTAFSSDLPSKIQSFTFEAQVVSSLGFLSLTVSLNCPVLCLTIFLFLKYKI